MTLKDLPAVVFFFVLFFLFAPGLQSLYLLAMNNVDSSSHGNAQQTSEINTSDVYSCGHQRCVIHDFNFLFSS